MIIHRLWIRCNGPPYLTFRGDECIGHLPLPLRDEIMGVVSKMADLRLADSVGIDFHKTGWSPYLCSALVVKNRKDLLLLQKTKKDMPYLYHGSGYQPGTFTLESTRPNYAQQALVNMMLLAIKSFPMSPFIEKAYMDELLRDLCREPRRR